MEGSGPEATNEIGEPNPPVEEVTFEVKVLKQTSNSVTIGWKLVPEADVYEIEKHHRRHGWESVVWTSRSPATVPNLEESFAYKLRIKALMHAEHSAVYELLCISPDFVVQTESLPPSNLSLQRAIKKAQRFLVKHILRRRPSLIESPGPNGYLPLANAIILGEYNIVDMLLTAGASVHLGNPTNGRTPLHLAFYYGRLPVARMLLNKKADLEAADVNGMTACHFAVDANQREMLKFALESGANAEARDACGWTLLQRAVVMRADLAILELLLEHGASAKVVDSMGQSCVDLARLYNNKVAVDYFANALQTRGDESS